MAEMDVARVMPKLVIPILLLVSPWIWTIQGFATVDQTKADAVPNMHPVPGGTEPGDLDGDGDVDFDDLIKRISDTKAIGILTKLSLKREIDGFEADLETFHDGKSSSSLDELRERYDLLVHKLLGLLQEKDADLARDIAGARDILWAKLADPEEFRRM